MVKSTHKNKKTGLLKIPKKMSKRNLIIIGLIGLILIGLTLFLRNEIATFVIGPEIQLPSQPAFYFSPSSGTAKQDESFNVDLLLNTEGLNIVAVSSYIQYDPKKIQVQNIDTSGSVFTYGVESSVDSEEGIIKITSGQPGDGVSSDNDDGYTGTNGKIATLSLRAQANAAGIATLDFSRSLADAPGVSSCKIQNSPGDNTFTCVSRMILDDGQGTDKLAAVNNGSYKIEPAVVVPPDDPPAANKKIRLKLQVEGRKNGSLANIKLEIKNRLSGEVIKSYIDLNSTTDGDVEIDAGDLGEDVYNVKLVIPGYLTRSLSSVTLPDSVVVFTPSKFVAGNLFDRDNIINALDAGVMNRRWSTSDTAADINQDGTVNTLDWGYINRNWGKSGD